MMTNEDANGERLRLQPIYAGLGDDQLLNLLREKDELTDVAQQVLDAEMASRGLSLPVDAEEQSIGGQGEDEDSSEDGFYRLWRFQLAADAEAAVDMLEDAGIACLVKGARARVDGVGELVAVPGLDLFVESADRTGAETVLHKKMKLFPLAETESVTAEDDGEEEPFVAGSFATEAEAAAFVAVLQAEGIRAEKHEEQDGEGGFWNVKVAFDDLPQATEVAERMETGQNA